MQSTRNTAIARRLRKDDSWSEKLMWNWLRGRRFSSYKFRRQVPMGSYFLDFFCPEARVDVEVDGFQHGYPGQREFDTQRDAWLESHGVKVLRFWNSQLRREQQYVRDVIWRVLHERAPRRLPEYFRPGVCSSNNPMQGPK